jgi:membrane-bound lytic murein transglycosylase D
VDRAGLVALCAAALLQACAGAGHFPSAPSGGAAIAPAPAAAAPAAIPVRVVDDPLRGLPKIDHTVPPEDLWDRVRRGFTVPDLDNELVREKTAYYAGSPEYLQRIFDRSKLYLFHVVEELEKRRMPTELALLPMVESAYNPMAYSRAHASGLWQFIPGTGKRYDLQQNWWYDGRRDIVDSTAAALDYLQKLYEIHGDWQLALASYNWGENAVARAVAKNAAAGLPTDYADLTMPSETRHYIPKLQALKNIIRDPQAFGIDLGPIPNSPYFTTAQVQDIDVQLAAKLAEMPVEEFIALNPGFSRPIIRASVTPRIVLPADKVEVFRENLEKHEKSLVSWKTYRPKKGDTLDSIARRHGLPVAQLKEVNGIAPRSRSLPALLVVPTDRRASAAARRLPLMYAPPIPVASRAATRHVLHIIKAGETLYSIARRYGVTVADLRRWNPATRVIAGGKLTIQAKLKISKSAG